eukprot:1023122-Pelagomonas_calceolata.AAC.4
MQLGFPVLGRACINLMPPAQASGKTQQAMSSSSGNGRGISMNFLASIHKLVANKHLKEEDETHPFSSTIIPYICRQCRKCFRQLDGGEQANASLPEGARGQGRQSPLVTYGLGASIDDWILNAFAADMGD